VFQADRHGRDDVVKDVADSGDIRIGDAQCGGTGRLHDPKDGFLQPNVFGTRVVGVTLTKLANGVRLSILKNAWTGDLELSQHRKTAKPLGRRISIAAAFMLASSAWAQLQPEWISHVNVTNTLSSGLQGTIVSDSGVTYVTGITGSSSNSDIITSAFNPDGSLLWSQVYDGPEQWHDQARALAFGPGGVVYVTGNTPSPTRRARVLLLKYDAATGTLLNTVEYSSGPNFSESGEAVVADALGNVYVGGNTSGDGPDTMVLKFDETGQLLWKRTWDGPAASPFSSDTVKGIALDPAGNPVLMAHGIWHSLHPDYVLIKYAASNGAVMWETNWGTRGGDFARQMEFDAAGDLYVTGTGLEIGDNRFATIKLQGSDGQLLWEAYDGIQFHNSVSAFRLDGRGGVYITGQVDPDGDRSNANNNFYTVKRDAASGELLWIHQYGANCLRCGDVPADIMVDSAGNVLLVGRTKSPPYNGEMILFVLDANTGIEIDRAIVGPTPTGQAFGWMLRADARENTYIGGSHSDPAGIRGMSVMKFASLVDGCYADCDQSTGVGVLDVFDFLCFQNSFVNAQPYACDCDTSTGPGVCDVFDFLCFQSAFVGACP
jgi:PQQ-like domain